MAFGLLGTTPSYQCLSTDTKLTSGVLIGAKCLETDTSKEFIFNGTAWVGVTDIAQWPVTGTSAVNTAKTITKAAVADKKHVITGFLVVLRAAAAGADISVALLDDVTVLWQDYFGVGAVRGERVGITFPGGGLEITTNKAANLTVGAGGAGAIAELNMCGYTKAA